MSGRSEELPAEAKPSARGFAGVAGLASLVLLVPSGCRRPTADLSVDPETGGEPVAAPAPDVACKPAEGAAAKPRPKPGQDGDLEPPEILGGRFVARDRVQLTFSEPLAPVDQVNPRQFRLSMAYSARSTQDYGGAGYASGYYYDLAGADNYEPPVVVTSLETYEARPEVLALQLSRPVPVELCVDMADAASDPVEGEDVRMGLYLHYTIRGSVGIRDLGENPLGDMGGEWALNYGARHKTLYGTDPVMRLDLLVELACPEQGLGVSTPPGPS
jgi:hypothetical protein